MRGNVMISTRSRALVFVAVLLVAVWGGLTAAAATVAQGATPGTTRPGPGLEAAVEWVVSQQGSDGAFIGFSGESDPGVTIDAIIALAAAQSTGIDTGTSIADAVAYLGSEDVALVYAQTGVGQAAKLVLGLAAAGENPVDFANVQPLTLIENGQDEETGVYGDGVYDHGLVMLALAATGTDVPTTAIDALAATQAPNGGWSFDGIPDDTAVDSNTTALIVQALVATGNGGSELIEPATAFLRSTVTDEGVAFGTSPDSVPDSNSTALVAQAYQAAGEDATALTETLLTFQNADGAFFYTAEDTADNLFSTVQAIPALAETPPPVLATPALDEATPATTTRPDAS